VGELEQQAAAAHAERKGLEALCVEQERLSAEELAREELTSAIVAEQRQVRQIFRIHTHTHTRTHTHTHTQYVCTCIHANIHLTLDCRCV
jgi:hypothetical protein